MKKLLLALAVGLSAATAAQAQVEIGLKITPSIGYHRVNTSGNPATKLESDGARVHFGGGLIMDYFFGENYAFNTGVELVGKGGKLKQSITSPATGIPLTSSTDIGLQYVQVPLAIKLFTNEVAPDTRIYFLVGGQLSALVGASLDGKKNAADGTKATKLFNTFDAGVQAGAGAELQLGKSTKTFGGFSYQHGLLDVADKSFAGVGGDNFSVKNSMINLDLGLKF